MSTDVVPDASPVWSESAGPPAAPLLVLVHGSMDRSAGLLRMSRRLDDEFRVLRFDRRGYARSIGVGPPYGVRENVDDLAGLIEAHAPGASAALVFGHSFGGNIALGLAARRPDLVEAVAVYETPLSWLDWWPGSTAGAAAVASTDPADAAEAFMRRLVGDAVWERLPASTRADRRAEGAAMVAELTDLRATPPWDAASITTPVLALAGEHARDHHRRGARAIATMIDGAVFEELPGAGHTAPNAHPTELVAVLRRYLSRLAC